MFTLAAYITTRTGKNILLEACGETLADYAFRKFATDELALDAAAKVNASAEWCGSGGVAVLDWRGDVVHEVAATFDADRSPSLAGWAAARQSAIDASAS